MTMKALTSRKAAVMTGMCVSALLVGVVVEISWPVPAEANTWYASCGPKINIRTGMSNIRTMRSSYLFVGSVEYLIVKLNRGLKSGWGQTGIWWAKLDPTNGPVHAGDGVNLFWTDYDPGDKANYCLANVTTADPVALTWGVNAVASGSNPWGRRLFAAYGQAKVQGKWQYQWADQDPVTNANLPVWVVSY